MTSDLCGKRPPRDIWRCELAKGHEGKHIAFNSDGSPFEEWPNHSDRKSKLDARRAPLKRGKRPRAVSDRQALDLAKWAGVKDAYVYLLNKLTPDGACCETCGVKGNRKTLDLDHVRSRAQGGRSEASNARLLCNRFHPAGNDCHGARHGQPEWSGEAS